MWIAIAVIAILLGAFVWRRNSARANAMSALLDAERAIAYHRAHIDSVRDMLARRHAPTPREAAALADANVILHNTAAAAEHLGSVISTRRDMLCAGGYHTPQYICGLRATTHAIHTADRTLQIVENSML